MNHYYTLKQEYIVFNGSFIMHFEQKIQVHEEHVKQFCSSAELPTYLDVNWPDPCQGGVSHC